MKTQLSKEIIISANTTSPQPPMCFAPHEGEKYKHRLFFPLSRRGSGGGSPFKPLFLTLLLLCLLAGEGWGQWEKTGSYTGIFQKFATTSDGFCIVTDREIWVSNNGTSWTNKVSGIVPNSGITCYLNNGTEEYLGANTCSNTSEGVFYKSTTGGTWVLDNGAISTNTGTSSTSNVLKGCADRSGLSAIYVNRSPDILDIDGQEYGLGSQITCVVSNNNIYYSYIGYPAVRPAVTPKVNKWTLFKQGFNSIRRMIFFNNSLYVLNGNFLWVANPNQTNRVNPASTTWTPISDGNIEKIFAASSGNLLITTTNTNLPYLWNGTNYQMLGNESANCIEQATNGRFFIGTANKGIGVSEDNGANWIYINAVDRSSLNITSILGLKIYSNTIIAVGADGNIYTRNLDNIKIPKINIAKGIINGDNKASIGELVTLTGVNLSTVSNITFGGVKITNIQSNSTTSVSFTIPDGSFVNNDINITVNEEMTVIYKGLQIVTPEIKSITPSTVFQGDESIVTIKGEYFDSLNLSVSLGTQAVDIVGKPTRSSVSFIVPQDVSGTKSVSIISNGKKINSPINLSITRPTITFSSPKVAETWSKSQTYTIKHTTNYTRNFILELTNSGNVVQVLNDNLAPNTDFTWKIPEELFTSNGYALRLTSISNSQVVANSSNFSISERPPLITDFRPKEGYPADTVWIFGKNFSLSENKVMFGSVEARLAQPPSTDTLVVLVPEFARGEVNLNVTANQQTASSKDKFRVITPFIQVLNPRQGERRFKGDTLTVVYRHNLKGNMRIELLNGGLPVDILTNSTEPSGRFFYEIPADGFASSFTYRFRVSSVVNPSISGMSGTISVTEPVPVIESVSPLEVGAGDTLTITGRNLSLNTASNLVRIGGVIAEPVALPQILQGGKPPLVQIKVRIPDRLIGRLNGTITVNNENPTTFRSQINVLPPFIEVTYPNGGERLVKGNLYEITWKDNIPGAVRIELLFAGTSPRPITNNVPSIGKFLWQVPVTDEIPEGNFYRIKITALENLLVSGTSKENFFISEAPVTILDFKPKTAPKGAVVSIQGTNFKRDSPAQPLRVKFGDFSVPVEDIEYVSPNLIRAVVPESVNFDSAKITLSTAGVSIESKDFFKIVPPFIRLLRPRGGESFDKGTETPIVYESNIGERVRIELLRGDRLIDVVRERAESTGSFNWFVPLTLRAGTDYRLRITSTRTANLFALSNPFTILPTDLQPPVIFNASFENAYTKGSRTSFSLQVQARDQDEEGGIRNVVCFYKGVTQTNFKQVICAASDINFTANISESEFDEIGLEYYFVATDIAGKTDRFPRIGTSQTYLRFGDLGLPINYKSFGTEVINYEILSIPLVLEKNTVADVFSKTLGDYNPRRWRMFQLKENDTSYVEMSDVSTLDIGKGYWLIAKNETEINTGIGRTFPANSNSPFILKTQKGANLIGNPYNFDLDWNKVVEFNRGRGVPELFVFEGGTWKKSTVLKKFRGGFIFNAFGNVDIAFPVSAKVGSSGRTESETQNAINAPNWEVQLNLQAGNYRNELGGFGMNPKASLGIDVFDRQPIPQLLANLATMFNNQLSINNDQNNQQLTTNNQPLTTKNIVPSKENFIWSFTTQSSFEEVLNLSWENTYFGQNDKQLFLYDEKAKRLTDMRKVQSYSFEGVRSFKIFFGDKNFINNELPELKASVFVYPNPFADDLHLSINVPENETSVMFGIYDVSGKLMRLENKGDLRAGVHEIILEGKDNFGTSLKSGAYLLQIHIGQSIEAWKVVKE